jgi:hypothetical protein
MRRYFVIIVLFILLTFIIKAQSPSPTASSTGTPACMQTCAGNADCTSPRCFDSETQQYSNDGDVYYIACNDKGCCEPEYRLQECPYLCRGGVCLAEPTPSAIPSSTPSATPSCTIDLTPMTGSKEVGQSLAFVASVSISSGIDVKFSSSGICSLNKLTDLAAPYDTFAICNSAGTCTISADVDLAGRSKACSDTSTLTCIAPSPTPSVTQSPLVIPTPIEIPTTPNLPIFTSNIPNIPCKPLDAILLTNDNKRLLRMFDYWIKQTTTIFPSPSASASPYTITEIIPCVEPSVCSEGLININSRCYDLGYPECPRMSADVAKDILDGTKTYTVYVGQPCITVDKNSGAVIWHLLETDTRIIPYTAHFADGMPNIG